MKERRLLSEQEIVTAITSSDVAAFRLLFDRYRNELYTYALKVVKQKELAEEIVQDAFIIIWNKRSHLQKELSIKAYLYKITQNLSFNVLKRAALDERLRQRVFHSMSLADNPEEQSDYNDTYAQIEWAIGNMPTRQRLIFQMSRAEEKSHEVIARELGISKNTVKDQIFKALKFIRHHLVATGARLLF